MNDFTFGMQKVKCEQELLEYDSYNGHGQTPYRVAPQETNDALKQRLVNKTPVSPVRTGNVE